MVQPVQIGAAAGHRDHVANAGFIQGKRVDLPFGDDLRLREGAKIHAEQDRARAGSLPFLALLALRLVRRAILDEDQLAVAIERKDDVAVCIRADFERIQRRRRDFSSGEVGGDLLSRRQNDCVRQDELLFRPDGGADDLRPLAKALSQFLKPASHAAGAALAHIHAFRQVERKGVPVAALAAVAKGTVFRNQLVPADCEGLLMLLCKSVDGFSDVHVPLPVQNTRGSFCARPVKDATSGIRCSDAARA